jgi:hypothetical protein
LDVSYNTADRVDAAISRTQLTDMIAAMDKAPTMTVAIGHGVPFVVSLAGSTKVTHAFLTCSGIKGGPASAANNPFE